MTEEPKRSLARMSTVGFLLAVLIVGVIMLLLYYFR
jgi:hypothetical protein